MSFREHLSAEVTFRKAEVEALAIQLKKKKKELRELSKFLEELINKSVEMEKENEQV